VIAIVGGGLGLAVAWPVVSYVGLQTNGMVPPLYLPTRDVVVGAAIILALGLATGLWPAVQASRLRIVDALRKG
jgi:putative ABC transport system permease protein